MKIKICFNSNNLKQNSYIFAIVLCLIKDVVRYISLCENI